MARTGHDQHVITPAQRAEAWLEPGSCRVDRVNNPLVAGDRGVSPFSISGSRRHVQPTTSSTAGGVSSGEVIYDGAATGGQPASGTR